MIFSKGSNFKKEKLTSEELQAVRERNITLWVYDASNSKKYPFVVPPLKLVQQKKIVDSLMKMNVDISGISVFESFVGLMGSNYDDVINIFAVATISPRETPTRKYLRFIKDTLDNMDAFKLWNIILKQMDPVRLVQGVALLKGININQS